MGEKEFVHLSLEEMERRWAEADRALKAAEDRIKNLQELAEAKSRFFANVSHECRTPLMLTLGPLEDLRDGLHGPLQAKFAKEIQGAIRNAHRLLHLINQLLDVVKIEAGKAKLRPRRLDFCRFIEDIAQSFSQLAERQRVRFRVEPPPAPAVLILDRDVLEKIIVNLVANAFKFTPKGGTVRLTARLEGNLETNDGTGRQLTMTIRDSGPGIAAEELPQIFDRFYQVGKSRSFQPGTGIGLSLTKELVELHGGSIEAESEEGFGTNFVVKIPLLERDQQDVEEPALTEMSSQTGEIPADGLKAGERAMDLDLAVEATAEDPSAEHIGSTVEEEDITTILMVDNNAETRSYISRHLAPPYRVLEAADGKEGLDVAKRRLPDLIISDVIMPGLDGYALSQAVIRDPELSYIPVILLTAKADKEHKIKGLESGAHDYLFKPFQMKELRAKITNLLDSRKRLLERLDPEKTPHESPLEIVSADALFLQRIRSVIETHLANEDFGVAPLAKKVGLSRGHLHRRLQELLKQTPTDVIRTMRLERAARLLKGKAGRVSEIAYATGFKSVAHFAKCFKDRFGHSPSQHIGKSSSDFPVGRKSRLSRSHLTD